MEFRNCSVSVRKASGKTSRGGCMSTWSDMKLFTIANVSLELPSCLNRRGILSSNSRPWPWPGISSRVSHWVWVCIFMLCYWQRFLILRLDPQAFPAHEGERLRNLHVVVLIRLSRPICISQSSRSWHEFAPVPDLKTRHVTLEKWFGSEIYILIAISLKLSTYKYNNITQNISKLLFSILQLSRVNPRLPTTEVCWQGTQSMCSIRNSSPLLLNNGASFFCKHLGSKVKRGA